MAPEKKPVKTFRTAPFDLFVQSAGMLNLTHTELAVKIGYSEGAVSGWKEVGKFPYVAMMACEGLLHRAKSGQEIFVVRAANRADALRAILTGLDLKFTEL